MLEKSSLCIGVVFLVACGDGAGPAPADPAGTSGSAGAQGVSGSTGVSGSSSGGTAPTPWPSYASYGGSDSGSLFGPNAVPYDASSQGGSGGTSAGGSGGTGGGGPPGDGNEATSTIRGSVSGTATFTQTGVSVTVEINLTGCPSGDLVFTIHDGFSCDNADTEGVPWGARGEIGTVNCNGNSGSGTFTRDGTDSNANWTVADHTLETDVSAHVIIVTTPADSETRIACGNFF